MNKFLLLFAVAAHLCSVNVQAQKRTVLIEEFTNMGCGPCASYAPTLDKVIDERLGDVIAVKYHGNYPAKNDWLYLENQEAVDKRMALYGINAFPTTIIDGKEESARYEALLHHYIDRNLMEEPSFSINLDTEVKEGILNYKAKVNPLENMSGHDLRLFIVVIEEYMKNDPAWVNGETDARYSVRKMLPGGDGYKLDDNLEAGKEYSFEGDCSIAHMSDVNEAGFVAFVQDMDSKKIMATCYVPRKAKQETGIEIKSVKDTPDLICMPEFFGKVAFRNSGSTTLTSAILNVEVNGSATTYPWSGNLEYLDKDTMLIEGFTDFTLSEGKSNNVKIWFSDINGTEIQSQPYSLTFSNSIQVKGGLQMKLYTDMKPEEITWKIYNSEGDVVQEGGPYSEPRKFYTENFMLDKDDCYMLEFHDSGKDGIKGANGNGYYQLFQLNSDGTKSNVGQGDYDGEYYDVAFRLSDADITLGVDCISKNSEGTVMVYDESGILLLKTVTENFDSNTLKALGNGVRLVKIVSGDTEETRKILVK